MSHDGNCMRDLDRALTDISVIREQLAQSTEFQGYAPATLAATGVFALLVAAAQGVWLPESMTNMRLYIALWVATAAVCVAITAIETIRRSRRAHGGFAPAMLQSALEQFVPAIVAGGLLTMALLELAPQDLWMIPRPVAHRLQPGVFASRRFLPRAVFWGRCMVPRLRAGLPGSRGTPACELAVGHGIPYGVGHLLRPASSNIVTNSSYHVEQPEKKSEGRANQYAYPGLDRVIHERARLSVLTSLARYSKGLRFGDLKALCGLTDGNLSATCRCYRKPASSMWPRASSTTGRKPPST